MTECERVETTIRKRQLWFAGALARQEETRLPRRLMNERLTARGPKEVGRPPKQWEDSLQEKLRALGAVPRKGAQREWLVYDVEVNDAYDWVTTAKSMGKWGLPHFLSFFFYFHGSSWKFVEVAWKLVDASWKWHGSWWKRRGSAMEARGSRMAVNIGFMEADGTSWN